LLLAIRSVFIVSTLRNQVIASEGEMRRGDGDRRRRDREIRRGEGASEGAKDKERSDETAATPPRNGN
jgi:hypothetical protein